MSTTFLHPSQEDTAPSVAGGGGAAVLRTAIGRSVDALSRYTVEASNRRNEQHGGDNPFVRFCSQTLVMDMFRKRRDKEQA